MQEGDESRKPAISMPYDPYYPPIVDPFTEASHENGTSQSNTPYFPPKIYNHTNDPSIMNATNNTSSSSIPQTPPSTNPIQNNDYHQSTMPNIPTSANALLPPIKTESFKDILNSPSKSSNSYDPNQSSDHLLAKYNTYAASQDEKPRPFICPECSYAFTRRDKLKRHMLIHTGEKNHVCPECSKAFARRDKLTRHLRTHSSEKMHLCAVCEKTYNDVNALKRHMRTHMSDSCQSMSHRCVMCGKSFLSGEGLRKHMRVHSQKYGLASVMPL